MRKRVAILGFDRIDRNASARRHRAPSGSFRSRRSRRRTQRGTARRTSHALQRRASRRRPPTAPKVCMRVAVESDPDIVLAATDGAVAFDAVFAAVERGIDIAVANKELIVAAGELLVDAARRGGAQLLPVDSRTQRDLPVSRRRGARVGCRHRAHRIRRTVPADSARGDGARDRRRRRSPSDVAHGHEKHHRFGHDDEQGIRSRSKPAASSICRPRRCTSSCIRNRSPTDSSLFTDGSVKGQLACSGHALADRLCPAYPGPAARPGARRRCDGGPWGKTREPRAAL